MSEQTDLDQIQSELEQLDEKSEQCFQDCRIRSALRIAREATQTAKTHGLATHYMRGIFDQMRFGHGVLDPQATRESAVELVALLEDEEQARRIQPDLDEGEYHWLCSWMTSCAYDNLAEATGMMSGYNSEGMHECINDGIQVCRQTGKLECIKCFREYAADVYLAADDLAMVRHQCQSLMDYRDDGSDDKDRRWSALDKLAWIYLLEGKLEQTIETLQSAMPLTQAENVYLKRRGKLFIAVGLDQALSLAGQGRFDWSEIDEDEIPAAGEWPKYEMERIKADCVAHVVEGNIDLAIETLTDWDRRLTELECGKEWFEIRLRLIAAYLIQGNQKRGEALAKGLEAKASETQDFLTLRRLQRLMSGQTPISPIPGLNDLDYGPYASTSQASVDSSEDSQSEQVQRSEETTTEEESTPLGEQLAEYMQGIMTASEDEAAQTVLFDRLLAHEASAIEHPQDASYLIHLSRFLIQGSEMARRAWEWAKQIQAKFSDHPKVQSVVADLGYYFHSADPAEFSDIELQELEKWYRLSLSLDLNDANNHARAGGFFFAENQMGEAERCYARAFRLNRTDGGIAQSLADLYHNTERPRDAMAVLDLCLREGSEEANVAWEAAMIAQQLEQFDLVLTYLDRFQELGEPQTWYHYYRANALLQLGRAAESLSELEEEEKHEPPGNFHLKAIRCSAFIELNRTEEARTTLQELIAAPLRQIDYLSMNGLIRLAGQVWESVSNWSEDDAERLAYEKHLLKTGLMPDHYFNLIRQTTDVTDEIHFIRVRLKQPLDADWSESAACLPGQDEWTDYFIDWGVLAKSKEEAVRQVQRYHQQGQAEAEVVDVDVSEETYRDRSGVVWQGFRWSQQDEFDLEE